MSDTIVFEKDTVADNGKLTVYEGEKPYIFISYSHRDTFQLVEVCTLFKKKNVKFWYDNGLYSGDDWNLMIASHLEKASACLLLLSRLSAESQYVKNELNFALSHRIPIHIILLEDFTLPIDIEMMIGRIQMVTKNEGYERRLLEALPGEIYDDSFGQHETEDERIEHQLFKIEAEIMNRQGTISYLGSHKTLEYKVLVQEECIINVSIEMVKEQAKLASKLSFPLFPKIYDIVINGSRMYTFQEYRGEVFLDQYLKDNILKEDQITEWIVSVIDALDYLFSLNLGFRDFARGSLIVTKDRRIGMFRLQNMYYGVHKLQQENKQFYFEKEIQEIAVLLYQLCTGEVPVLPFRIISNDLFSKNFIDKVNLIIQKSTREHNRICYNSFEEIKKDLRLHKIKTSDVMFLRKRRAKLKQYEDIKRGNLDRVFTGNEEAEIRKANLEEEFGFEATVTLAEMEASEIPVISVLICSTGQLLEFSRTEILIGRSPGCDMILNQPSVSRYHVKICRGIDGCYQIEDLNTANGTFLISAGERIQTSQKVPVSVGEYIRVGGVMLQLL